MTMSWTPAENSLLGQLITEDSTTEKHQLGTIVRAKHATLGVGEFIYLKGVASTVVGSIVNYDDTWQTALDSVATAGPSRPLAVAMSACVANEYGWYQISGMAVATKANSVSFADGAGLGSASGLAVAVATGSVIQGAVVRTVASAKSNVTTVSIAINRPHGASDVS
jgi:hypothetical protein